MESIQLFFNKFKLINLINKWDKGYNVPKMTKNRPKKFKTPPKIFDDQILY
jgi:hypothetical protein